MDGPRHDTCIILGCDTHLTKVGSQICNSHIAKHKHLITTYKVLTSRIQRYIDDPPLLDLVTNKGKRLKLATTFCYAAHLRREFQQLIKPERRDKGHTSFIEKLLLIYERLLDNPPWDSGDSSDDEEISIPDISKPLKQLSYRHLKREKMRLERENETYIKMCSDEKRKEDDFITEMVKCQFDAIDIISDSPPGACIRVPSTCTDNRYQVPFIRVPSACTDSRCLTSSIGVPSESTGNCDSPSLVGGPSGHCLQCTDSPPGTATGWSTPSIPSLVDGPKISTVKYLAIIYSESIRHCVMKMYEYSLSEKRRPLKFQIIVDEHTRMGERSERDHITHLVITQGNGYHLNAPCFIFLSDIALIQDKDTDTAKILVTLFDNIYNLISENISSSTSPFACTCYMDEFTSLSNLEPCIEVVKKINRKVNITTVQATHPYDTRTFKSRIQK
jgi:hypothetical protein